MVRGGCCLATANVTSRGPLNEYLLQADGQTTLALAVQGHHCAASVLATQQRAAKDAGWHGVWSAATPSPTSTTGSIGGVAVLAPASIQLTGPPGRDSHVLVPGRLVAGHVRAGPQGGAVVPSVHLHVGESLSANNLGILWQLAQHLGVLEAEGYHWAATGDWNMEADVLDFGWVRKLRAQIRATHDDQGLQILWGLLLEGVETEILNRRDLVGPARRAFAGRGTRKVGAGLRWEIAQWRPPQKRKLRGLEAHAWAALVAGWASGGKCMKSIAATLAHLRTFLADIEDHVHWRILPPWAQRPFRADANWAEADFERDFKRALAEARERLRKLVQAPGRSGWMMPSWAALARRTRPPRCLCFRRHCPRCRKKGSAALVDGEMKPWIDIWNYRGLTSVELPNDAHTRDELPPVQLHNVRDVLRSFPWRTWVGQSGIPPRALEDLSDDALRAMIAVYHKCEELLAWPSGRLINTMVRLPKPDGGCRLIATLVRLWSRARRPITKAWELAHPSPLVWSTGPGRSSSGSAYELNLAKEQARLGGSDSAQVALDLWKAYELVAPEAQLVDARAPGSPLRLAWVLLSTYRQPRTLAAFNTTSDLFVAWQGKIAGCGHANSLLL
ncbi:unnamed protein product, partial [Prorocentrum cordatum]